MEEKIDLSIIILSYNTRELLKKCLDSVISDLQLAVREKGRGFDTPPITNHQPPITEIIVVDNGSTDGSVEEIKNEKLKIKNKDLRLIVIENKENVGFARGNNVGLKIANGRYILFLNSDTEIFPGSLKEAIDFMDSDKTIGAMTPKTVLYSGKIDPDCHRGFPTPWASLTYFLGLEKLFPKSRLFGQYHKFYQDLDKPHEIDAGFGTFLLIRKEVYKAIGGWDESYFFYGEDLDYFYRVKQAGWKVMFYPKILLKHHKGGSSGLRKESKKITLASRETRIKTARASIRAMEIFYKKFYKDKYPNWLTFLVLSAIKVKGVFRLLKHYINK
ncbi:MAG: N-acetylglucosaminyl-diphospho-decaprenol L-rhamnosyltransferase [Microgenomates group bacterium ADurb.Bin219]|nr:MAG: N-acetylglucosaminyl-diphospho-decaprenol L-rhamnosyltransferase [Microgenomates group bacterium ADurb.Bin219]